MTEAAKLRKFDQSRRDSVAISLKLVRSARHQHCKYDRHENKRWHISHQMTALGRVAEGLNAHDRRVNHARPHGEPDEALVSVGISCGDEQKHAQRRVHSNDHHEIVRMPLSPSPARGPENTQCIYAKYESQTDNDQGYAKKKQTICIRHLEPPNERQRARLLRACRQRPCCRRAAEQHDELAAFHCPVTRVRSTQRISHRRYGRRLLRLPDFDPSDDTIGMVAVAAYPQKSLS